MDSANSEIDSLKTRLTESNVRISKNLLYVIIAALGFLIYIGMTNLNNVNTKLIEMTSVIEEYKAEIEKTQLYNRVLEQKIIPEKGVGTKIKGE